MANHTEIPVLQEQEGQEEYKLRYFEDLDRSVSRKLSLLSAYLNTKSL